MSEAVYRMMTLVGALVVNVPMGTNLGLLTSIQAMVIAPAEAKVEELRTRRQEVYQPDGAATVVNTGEGETTS